MESLFPYEKFVTGKQFVGRKTESSVLANLLRSGEHAVIYEPPKAGKTSLVQQALFNLNMLNYRPLVVTMNLFNILSESDFLCTYGTSVIRSLCSTPAEYENVVTKYLSGSHFCFDYSRFSDYDEIISMNWDIDETDFFPVLNLPVRLAADMGKDIVVVIDEFQKIACQELGDKILRTMKKVLLESKSPSGKSTFVLCGSEVNAMKDIFRNHVYFTGTVTHVAFKPIDSTTIVDHIRSGFSVSGKVCERDVATGPSKMFESSMWYLNHMMAICDSLTKGYVNEGIMLEALRMLISIHEPRFRSMMSGLTGHQISFLRAIVDGETKFSSSEVIRKYRLNSSANVIRVKEALMKKEVITFGDKDEALFLDPLFGFWVTHNYFNRK